MAAKKHLGGKARAAQNLACVADDGARNLGKVTPPTLLRVHANRRLFQRLQEAAGRITWIYGQPGAGKTTLVASYLSDRGIEPLWYRLDEADADPATLFSYFRAAWRGRKLGLSLPLLTPEHRVALPLFARRFFRDLFRCSHITTIVFDDHHEVPPAALLHRCLAAGFEEVPNGCRVIVVSRVPPPPEMARLRLNGVIDVIDPEALRLTLEEARGLARERGAELDRVGPILDRTMGWTAGLILMLEAGSHATTPERASDRSELLFDYFAGEIFQRMAPRHRRLLCILALMPTITARSAERLTGSRDAGALLEDFRKRNYFTGHDAAPEPNYRFHPLFRDFLLESGSTLLPKVELASLRLAAAALLEESGQIEAAFALLGIASAHEQMAALVKRHAETLIDEGRNDTLLSWLATLGKDMVAADAWLNHWSGLAITYDRPDEAAPFFRRAFALFEAARDVTGQFVSWSGEAEAVRVDAFGSMTRYDELIEIMRELLMRHAAIDDPKVMLWVATGMATGLSRRTARRDEIELWQQRAREAAKHTTCRGHALLNGFMFAITHVHDANYVGMRNALEALPDPRSLDHLPYAQVSGLIAHVLARLYRVVEGECAILVEDSIVRLERNGYLGWTPLLASCAANDACRKGDVDGCARWLKRAAVFSDRVSPDRNAHYYLSAAQYLILKGEAVAAKAEAAKAIDLACRTGWLMFEALAILVAAEADVELRSFREAERKLQRLDEVLARSTTRSLAAPAFLLRADLEATCGDAAAAERSLREGLTLARRQDDRRLPLSFPRLGRLMARALRSGIEPTYVTAYIRDLDFPAPDPHDPAWPWPLKIATFGGLRIEIDGEPLAFHRKTPKRLVMLLKAILSHGGRDVPDEKLIDAVWVDEDGDRAQNALKIAIHRLRKLLGGRGLVVWKNGRVGLDPTRCWVDFWVLEHAGASPGSAHAGLHHPTCRADATVGDFLAGDDDLWWTRRPRDRFNRLRGCVPADL